MLCSVFISQVDVSYHFLDINLLESKEQKKVCLLIKFWSYIPCDKIDNYYFDKNDNCKIQRIVVIGLVYLGI